MSTRLTPNRALPGIPAVDGNVLSHTPALRALTEHAETGARRSKDVLSSFVRVQDLVDIGLIKVEDGNLALPLPPQAPQYTTGERDALRNVPAGTLILNTTTNQAQMYINNAWVSLN